MSAEPSILIRKLRPQDLFLIFASDGLWEQLSDDLAVEIVVKNPRVVSPASAFLILSFHCFIEIICYLMRTGLTLSWSQLSRAISIIYQQKETDYNSNPPDI